jgi:hypothetical protein
MRRQTDEDSTLANASDELRSSSFSSAANFG